VLLFDRISSIEYSNDTFGGDLGSVFVEGCGGGSDVSFCGGLLPLLPHRRMIIGGRWLEFVLASFNAKT